MQLQWKADFVLKCFETVPGVNDLIRTIIPNDPPWGYRNKMEFTFSSDAKGERYLGLILDGSRGKVFKLTECHLVHPWFAEAVKATDEWWGESKALAYHPHKNQVSLRTLTLREGLRTGDRMVVLTVSGLPEYALHKQQLDQFVKKIRSAIEPADPEAKLNITLIIHQALKGQPTQFYEMQLYGPDHIREMLHVGEPFKFHISPQAFFQPNTRSAERLYQEVLKMARLSSEDVVYDLYCGTGTLGIIASKTVKEVIGIELSPESSLDARTNATLNGCANVTILTGDVGAILLRNEYSKPNVVLVDPPRAGLSPEAIDQILALKPERIVYVSCNPLTQARDVAPFLSQAYRLNALQPLDQCPHTIHIENIALLEKSRCLN
jgi:23S rRNA (uracil1939-C5)-methyltransferase